MIITRQDSKKDLAEEVERLHISTPTGQYIITEDVDGMLRIHADGGKRIHIIPCVRNEINLEVENY